MVCTAQAWIYTGTKYDGVCSSSVRALKQTIEQSCEDVSVCLMDARDLKTCLTMNLSSDQIQKTVIVFPGGKASAWDDQLGSHTIQKIREFVMAGGKALMMCAGAYFSATSSDYKVSDSESIIKQRALKFFPGKAKGPFQTITHPVSGRQLGNSVGVECTGTDEKVNIYCFGGGYFLPDEEMEEDRDYDVLARYSGEEQHIAIASTQVGDGIAVMSFPHFEFDSVPVRVIPDDDDWLISYIRSINRQLSETQEEKVNLIKTIFAKLKI
jgi:glutamine amidotransferase-like uncharacterized protein